MVCAILTASFVPSLHAEIFSLWPFSERKTTSASAVSETLGARQFWSEPIFVNGISLQLNISMLDTTLNDITMRMKNGLDRQNTSLFAGKDSLFIQQVREDGSIDRTYYLQMPGVHPVLEFQMRLPAERRKPDPADFPKELP